MPTQHWTLVAHDVDGDYSMTEGGQTALTREDLLRTFTKGTTLTGNRVVALFRSHAEAERAFPRLNWPPLARATWTT